MLDKLRKKSEQTRMLIAIIVAVFITLIVAAFWVWSTTGRFTDSKETVQNDVKPFGLLKESFSGAVDDYQEQRDASEQRREESGQPTLGDLYRAQQENFQDQDESYLSSDDVEISEIDEAYGFEIIEEE